MLNMSFPRQCPLIFELAIIMHISRGERDRALMDLWAFSKETLLMSGAEALLCACMLSVI